MKHRRTTVTHGPTPPMQSESCVHVTCDAAAQVLSIGPSTQRPSFAPARPGSSVLSCRQSGWQGCAPTPPGQSPSAVHSSPSFAPPLQPLRHALGCDSPAIQQPYCV
jgi:hypothetical protein